MASVAVRILHNDSEHEKQVSSLALYVFVHWSPLHLLFSPALLSMPQ